MKLEELYAKCDQILGAGCLNVSPIDHFVFDLTDDNSQKSLKGAFPGIESVLMPEEGKFLVVATIVENPEILVLMFPEQTDGSLGLFAFNTKTKRSQRLDSSVPGGEEQKKTTLDNFNQDFAVMEDIARRFNEFVFSSEGENSNEVVKDIGSFEVSDDEPVEIKDTNTTTDNEETKMKFKPIDENEETKWIEIPNTNAHGVTVTEDDAAADPFADQASPEGDAAPAGDAPAPEGDAAPAEAPAEETPPAEEAPAETVDDPKAKMRELLAYYTNYMNELVQDPNTSTDLISATQEMIDSLIKNMESADGIEEVKAEQEEAAKEEVSAEETPPAEEAPAEEAPAEEAPAEEPVSETQEKPITDIPIQEEKQENPITDIPVQENVDDEQAALDAKIDSEIDDLHKDDWENIEPATSDSILTPGDIANSPVNDVDLAAVPPTPEEQLATTTPDMEAPAPTSDVLDDTTLPTPEEEDALFGDDDGFEVGADGLPLDTFGGDIDAITTTTPVSKKINWSSDYSVNGIATTDDNTLVVPQALKELEDYYKKVADEVSKVPGKEDVTMKLQKIQILTQTISNEWNGIMSQIGDGTVANSLDRSVLGDLEKDEIDQAPAYDMVGADVMADQEQEEEDDLAINNQIAAFCENFKHLI